MTARRLRPLAAALGALAVFIAVAGGVGLLLLPRLVERALIAELDARGLGPARVRVARLGLDSADLRELRLGREGALAAARLIVRYRLERLLEGRLEAVAVRGLRVRGRLDAEGLDLGGLRSAFAGVTEGEAGVLPVALIEVEEATARLETPIGPLDIVATGRLTARERDLEAGFDVDVASAPGRLQGRLVMVRDDAGVRARLVIAQGAIAFGPMALEGIGGSLRASGRPWRVDAELGAAALATPWARLTDLTLEANGTAAGLTASLAAIAPGGEFSLALSADLAAARRFTLEATAEVGDLAATLAPMGVSAGGRASATLRIEGDFPKNIPRDRRELAPWLVAQSFEGALALALERARLGGRAEGVNAEARLELEAAGGSLAVAAVTPLALSAEGLEDERLVRLLGRGPLILALGADDHTLPVLEAGPAEGGSVPLLLALGGTLEGRRARLDGEAVAQGTLAEGRLVRLELPALDVRLSELALAGVTGAEARLMASLGGDQGGLAGPFEATAAAQGVVASGVRTGPLWARLAGALRVTGEALSASLGGGDLRARSLAVEAFLATDEGVAATLAPGGSLRLDLAAGEGSAALRLADVAGEGVLRREDQRFPWRAALKEARIEARFSPRSAAGMVAFDGGALELPSLEARIADARGRLGLGPTGPPTFELAHALVDLSAHGLAPLVATATLRREDATLLSEGALALARADARLSYRARHDLVAGRGEAALELGPLRFGRTHLQLADLAPGWTATIRGLTGTLTLDGHLAWDASGEATDLRLALDDLAGEASGVRFAGVSGVVTFDRLWPPTTPPGQELVVGLLDPGLPLRDGLLRFRLEPQPALAVEAATWRWAGGEISLDPVRLVPGREVHDLVLAVRAIDLPTLVGLAEIEGLEATGRLSGRLPVRLTAGRVVVEKGTLAAEGPGLLRYAPRELPAALRDSGEGVTLMLAALANFRYETLRLTLDKPAEGAATVTVRITGTNPDFYEGHPVDFTLTLNADLEALLGRGLEGYRVPEAVRRRLQGGGP